MFRIVNLIEFEDQAFSTRDELHSKLNEFSNELGLDWYELMDTVEVEELNYGN